MEKLKKLFKFLFNLVYPTVLVSFVVIYADVSVRSNELVNFAVTALFYFIMPVLAGLITTGFIGLLVLHIKEACAERRENKKLTETAETTDTEK